MPTEALQLTEDNLYQAIMDGLEVQEQAAKSPSLYVDQIDEEGREVIIDGWVDVRELARALYERFTCAP